MSMSKILYIMYDGMMYAILLLSMHEWYWLNEARNTSKLSSTVYSGTVGINLQ